MTSDDHKDIPEEPKRAYDQGRKDGFDEGYVSGTRAVIKLLLRFLEEIKP